MLAKMPKIRERSSRTRLWLVVALPRREGHHGTRHIVKCHSSSAFRLFSFPYGSFETTQNSFYQIIVDVRNRCHSIPRPCTSFMLCFRIWQGACSRKLQVLFPEVMLVCRGSRHVVMENITVFENRYWLLVLLRFWQLFFCQFTACMVRTFQSKFLEFKLDMLPHCIFETAILYTAIVWKGSRRFIHVRWVTSLSVIGKLPCEGFL